jgi:hypothetical protein
MASRLLDRHIMPRLPLLAAVALLAGACARADQPDAPAAPSLSSGSAADAVAAARCRRMLACGAGDDQAAPHTDRCVAMLRTTSLEVLRVNACERGAERNGLGGCLAAIEHAQCHELWGPLERIDGCSDAEICWQP